MPLQFFETLKQHAERRGDAQAVCMVDESGEITQTLNYRPLNRAIKAFATDAPTKVPLHAPVLLHLFHLIP